MGQLDKRLQYNRRWLDRYFPEVAERGHPEYADLERMTPLQAEACRVDLMQELEYLSKRATPRPSILPEKEDGVNGFALRAARYQEALEDLCETFGLKPPIVR